MVMWRVDDAQVRDVVTGELLRDLVGATVQIVQRDTETPVPIFDAVGDPIADSELVVTPVFTVPRFWVDTATPEGLYLDWWHEPNDVRGPVEFEAVLRDAALAAAAAAAASATAAADAATAPTVEMVEPIVDAAVDAAVPPAVEDAVTDAMADYPPITVSDTAPVAPVVGHIWFDIS